MNDPRHNIPPHGKPDGEALDPVLRAWHEESRARASEQRERVLDRVVIHANVRHGPADRSASPSHRYRVWLGVGLPIAALFAVVAGVLLWRSPVPSAPPGHFATAPQAGSHIDTGEPDLHALAGRDRASDSVMFGAEESLGARSFSSTVQADGVPSWGVELASRFSPELIDLIQRSTTLTADTSARRVAAPKRSSDDREKLESTPHGSENRVIPGHIRIRITLASYDALTHDVLRTIGVQIESVDENRLKAIGTIQTTALARLVLLRPVLHVSAAPGAETDRTPAEQVPDQPDRNP